MTNKQILAWWEENQGKEVRDKVTGFTGTATACAFHLTQCATIGVQSKYVGEKQEFDTNYFDIQRIDIISEEKVVSKASTKKGAGPNPTSSRKDPS